MRRLLLGMAIAATAMLLPTVAQADDHQIAEFIKSRLQVEQQRGNLRGFNVDMRVDRGTVWFKGFVADTDQEKLILTTAQKAGYLGVVQVVDDIEIQESEVAQVQQPMMQQVSAQQPLQQRPMASNQESDYYRSASYQEPTNYLPPQPQMPAPTTNVYSSGTPLPFANAGGARGSIPAIQASTQDMMGQAGGYGGATYDAGMGMGMANQAPMAMSGPMGGGGGMASGTPNMPGYAWPGYAASPNYGAVSYPKQYSPSAWPYIGPFYPYPQVPLGWRKVSLEWDDGWWFLDFHDR